MSDNTTGDRQYLQFIEFMRTKKPQAMGLMTSWSWYDDPRRLAFTLSRYKFVAKMLEGAGHVLEVGCGDGFGSHVVAQAVGSLTGVDIEPEFIASAQQLAGDRFPIAFQVHDMMTAPLEGSFDGVYAVDVLEHILPEKEDRFLSNMIAPLTTDGVCIIGMPSLESQVYASTYSRMGHVNCKPQKELKQVMQRFFRNVFTFSMNDEVVHTGFASMAHYNFALCCGKIGAETQP